MLGPRTVVQRFLDEALIGGDTGAAETCVANGPFRERVLAFRRAFPDLVLRVEQVVSEGDVVAIRATGRGTHIGLHQGVPASGRVWTAPCTAIFHVTSGRIVEAWMQRDELAILEQIGGVRRVEIASA